MVEGLKPLQRASLLQTFGSADDIFRASEMELSSVPDIKPELSYRICHFDLGLAEDEMKKAANFGFRLVSLSDDDYPELLKRIPDPPVVLYIRGELLSGDVSVAVVGSRKATPYGLNVAHFLARDLGTAGITIVSGLARGIDARAHSAALEAGTRTVAVLGSGLDVIYPSEHKGLAQRIADQGAVVSEFPLGAAPDRENFPVRNRIISGLSCAVIVVEASNKSGSLITARMAAEQGREVLACPGSIFSESSKGCHSLLKDGASLVRDWKDVIAELPEHVTVKMESKKAEEKDVSGLTQLEKRVMDSLSFEQPTHVDQIAVQIGIASQELLGILVTLEMKNYISQMPGKHFIRVQ